MAYKSLSFLTQSGHKLSHQIRNAFGFVVVTYRNRNF